MFADNVKIMREMKSIQEVSGHYVVNEVQPKQKVIKTVYNAVWFDYDYQHVQL